MLVVVDNDRGRVTTRSLRRLGHVVFEPPRQHTRSDADGRHACVQMAWYLVLARRHAGRTGVHDGTVFVRGSPAFVAQPPPGSPREALFRRLGAQVTCAFAPAACVLVTGSATSAHWDLYHRLVQDGCRVMLL